jgi:hypothetical protein
MLAISTIAHEELIKLLENTDDPRKILRYLPKWETVDRLEHLTKGYRAGTLTPLEIAELDAVLELMPAIHECCHPNGRA